MDKDPARFESTGARAKQICDTRNNDGNRMDVHAGDVLRLFFHLANLYDGANSQRLVFQKRYDDICTEWLGGLTILAHDRRSSASSSVIT